MYINYGAINKFNYFIKEFYGREPISFKNITDEKINTLKQKSINYNNIFNEKRNTTFERYLKVMKMIKYSKRNGKFNDDAEKLICFMFSIDPSFEIIKIVNEFNKIDEIKMEIVKKFGVYDINLIKIEKYYISRFLPKEEKEELENEIEKRIWK